jgi:hypothetical protein
LARWIQDRDAFLPHGSLTAHHIDSHDTFWWSSWGAKWRREQFSLVHVQLLTVIFMSLPGPFMMFTGGEQGIEHVLEALNSLKQATPDWAELKVQWLNDDSMPEDVFGMVRSNPQLEIITLVNLGAIPETILHPSSRLVPKVRLQLGQTSTITNASPGLSLELSANRYQVLFFKALSVVAGCEFGTGIGVFYSSPLEIDPLQKMEIAHP